ncbi:RHS repeat-associated core domain-containing protein [Salmonella enterica]
MTLSLFTKTPEVTVIDNRALTIREIAYSRHPDAPDTTDERITRHSYDARSNLRQGTDPRLYDAGLANFVFLADLAGTTLRTQSVDAGTSVTLNDAATRLFLVLSNIGPENDRSQAVTQRWLYEDDTLPGRLLAITEQVADEAARVTDRYVYGGNSAAEQDFNLAGQVISQYDTAGLLRTDSLSVTGAPLSVTRQLMKEADNPDTVVDWQGGDSSAWNDRLDADAYTTLSTVDTTGTVLTTTDATGNVQRVAFDVTGLLKGSWLTLRGGSEQVIVKSLTYSAAGQKLREEHGNGVVTSWRYEPETQRLTEVSTERPAGHAAGAKVLQDLRYEYDPVGNILVITNDAEETRFWRNTEVVPENRYTYDSLYQLVSATGREMANAVQQTSDLPDFTTFDNATYTNYTRNYSYDRAGNLTRVQHSAPASGNSYTTTLTVSDRSNRAVLSTLTENPAEVDALFKAGGEQLVLLPGQELVWTPRGELQKVTPVTREGAADDSESYRYDAGSQRTVKVSSQLTGGSTRTQRVVYLPGLELHTTYTGDTESENLQVICVGEAGRAQVRVLHWESGQPADSSNDPLRYSYDNLTGSSVLEVDGSGELISQEEYYPYGGTALFAARSQTEADYKTVRYSGKERDATGLYYYGYRYYQPWAGRWLSADPSGAVDGLNLYRMVRNNPIRYLDDNGLKPQQANSQINLEGTGNVSTSREVLSLKSMTKNIVGGFTDFKNSDVMEYLGGITGLHGQSYGIGYEYLIKDKKLPKTLLKLENRGNVKTVALVADLVSRTIEKHKPIYNFEIELPASIRNEKGGNTSYLTGFPARGATSGYSTPLEWDVEGNEILYRSIPTEHYEELEKTKKLMPTSETSTSPAVDYSAKYYGELVRFVLKPGTIEKLMAIGGVNSASARKYLDLKILTPGWTEEDTAGFKPESNQMTIQLGQKKALDIFNENIITYRKLNRLPLNLQSA